MTAAAPAVNARRLLAGRVATELGELAVVPMTWRKERPASVLALFDFVDDFAMCEVGVNRTPQGPTLNREFVGVAMTVIEGALLSGMADEGRRVGSGAKGKQVTHISWIRRCVVVDKETFMGDSAEKEWRRTPRPKTGKQTTKAQPTRGSSGDRRAPDDSLPKLVGRLSASTLNLISRRISL